MILFSVPPEPLLLAFRANVTAGLPAYSGMEIGEDIFDETIAG
jgi:hypothetical protein